MRKKRSHKLRNGVLGLGGLGALAYLLLFQWHGGDGFLGDVAERARETAGMPPPDAAPARDGAATVERCQLRLGPEGLALAGEPAELEEAVSACEEAGAADLVVTGDARYGEFEDIQSALEAAGIEVYQR